MVESPSSSIVESPWWLKPRSPRKIKLTGRAKGYAYGTAAVMMISPDAMFCRLPSPEEDVLLVTAMRCAWIFFFCSLTLVFQNGCSVYTLLTRIRSHLRPLLLVGLTVTVTSTGFPLSLQLTGSAEALLLISLSPLWGAVIGWRFLGDRLPLRTKLALLGALTSIALIFVPQMIHGMDVAQYPRPNRLLGDVLALITGVGLGAYGNAIRYASSRHPNMPAQAAQLFSNFNAMSLCLFIAACSSRARPLVIHEPQKLWWVTLLMGFHINIAYLGFNVAPKYINAAEFGVICLLEAVIGPVWVFLLVGEAPSSWTLVGGAVLLTTMVSHEVASQLASKRAAKPREDCAAVAALAMIRVEAPKPPLSSCSSTSTVRTASS